MNLNQELDNQTLKYRVAGDLTSTNSEALRAEIVNLLATSNDAPQKWNNLVLDLSTAKMVDSAGLNLVVSLLKCVQKRGAKMQVTYSDQNVLRTFAFTRLDKHIEMVKV
jgi:anti-anti-sigma factor